jgi:iron complex outermembrane receptor protein
MRIVKLFFLVLLSTPMCIPAGVTSATTIKGSVLDASTKAPIIGAAVAIPALRKGAATGAEGRFSIQNVPQGHYSLTVSALGYASATKTVEVLGDSIDVNVALAPSDLQLPTVTVTAGPQPTDVLTSTQSVSVLEGRALEESRGQTIMQSLENLPSVSILSTGAAIGKPVVRGLSSQRVLVVDDGIRQEGQQWGDEHAPEIDAFDAEKIEVIRGPGSVLYGSDALGGVVHIVKPEVGGRAEPYLNGALRGDLFSNNKQGAGGIMLSGGVRNFGFRGALSGRSSGNTMTPAGELFNTGSEEINGSGMVGYESDEGFADVGYTHFGTKAEFHEDPAEDPLATPYQKIIHDKVHLHAGYTLPFARFEAIGGYQENWRREFEEKDAADPVLNLKLKTTSVDVKAHHNAIGALFGTAGLSLLHQQNQTLAEEHLIAPATSDNVAAFLYEEFHASPQWTLSGAGRYDSRVLDVDEDVDLGVAAQERRYHAFTGSFGISFRPVDPFAVTASVARGWRAPTEFELFANGVHEGTASYEIGNSTLEPEFSFNADVSFRYASPSMISELTLFNNRIGDYIYDAPTGDVDTAGADPSGFPIFHISQANATLRGIELSIQYQASSHVIISAAGDFMTATNDATDNPLPRIPASKIILGAKLLAEDLGFLERPYLDLKMRGVNSQTEVDPLEEKTAGYTLFDVGIGCEIRLGMNKATLDLAARNIFDRAYSNHLNRLKAFSLDPGRNIIAHLSIPFSLL